MSNNACLPAAPISHETVDTDDSRLKNFPVSWFSTVMGMSGLSIAWNRAEHFFNPGFCLSSPLLGLTSLWFVVLTIIYATKIARYPAAVMAEIRHPVKLAFIPTFSISLLLLSIAYLQSAPDFSFWLWSLGAILHLGITFYVISSWIHHTQYEITHLNPAWFIPVVGNILVPIAGMQHGAPEICWFFFSLGLFFWPVLTTIIFYRLIFLTALPERLLPTLFIFIAPPAVGFISWFTLIGSVDAFARILYSVAVAFTLLLLSQLNHFRRIPFFLSWWAYSFPLAAITIATFLMAKATGQAMYIWIGGGLLGLTSALIAMLVWRTIRAVMRREICVEGH
ncbi:MAG: SLAC1 anion channel family protein [Accumulibacter sp.]|uniref:SLAC1 anion channel family protein n=1 Tax=Accumulibacter sp. TaxID=2053492 RepID=UPI003315BF83